MRTLENDVPEVLLELAREAFTIGMFKVRIGFMYMGSEFVSPIEWALWLSKRDGGELGEGSYISPITIQRGDAEATSYVRSTTGNWQDATYWGPKEIREWMYKPLPASGKYTPAWAPATDEETQAHLLEQWPLFEAGVRSGWTMGREVGWRERLVIERVLKSRGMDSPEDYALPFVKLNWEAGNSFYNYKGHEAHRSTGAEVSTGGWSVFHPGEQEEFYRSNGSDPVRLSREEIEALLGATAPWFVRVAEFDDGRDEWLHYPEALQPPEFTISPKV